MKTAPTVFCWRPGDGENFGDSLGPVIVNAMLEFAERVGGTAIPRNGAGRFQLTHDPRCSPKFISIGSVAHFGRPGDIIWGAGIRCEEQTVTGVKDLNILGLRGRLSAELLGLEAGEMGLGDPAMLLPYLANALDWPLNYRSWQPPQSDRVALIPNLRQLSSVRSWPGFPWRDRNIRIVSPYLPWHEVLRMILESDRVIATSLHGLILAEAFGVPVTWPSVPPLEEGTFKFRDYFSSTGRFVDVKSRAAAIDELLDDDELSGPGESAGFDIRSAWNPKPLWNAFPWAAFKTDAPAFPEPQGDHDSVKSNGRPASAESQGLDQR